MRSEGETGEMKWNRFTIRGLFMLIAVVAVSLAWYTERIVFPAKEGALVANFAGDRCVYEWEFAQPVRSASMKLNGKPFGEVSSAQPLHSLQFFAGFEPDGSGRLDVAIGNSVKTSAVLDPLSHTSRGSSFRTERKITLRGDSVSLYRMTWQRDGKEIRTLEVFAAK